MAPKILTIRDAATITGLSERWIRMQIKAGKLPASKEAMGSLWVYLVSEEDLMKWAGRPMLPRGKAGGPQGRARYIVSVPPTHENEAKIVAALQESGIEDVTLKRGNKVLLNVRPQKGD